MRLETRIVRFKCTTLGRNLDNVKEGGGGGGGDQEQESENRTLTVWMSPIGGKPFLPVLSENEPAPSSSYSGFRDSPSVCSEVKNGATSPAGCPPLKHHTTTSNDGGVATFCDWSFGKCRSSDFATRSVSALSPRSFQVASADQKARKARLKQWRPESRAPIKGHTGKHFHVRGLSAAGVNNSVPDTSRMFTRVKTGATKGEKEIMMGICQNRGDIAHNSYADCPDCLMSSYGLTSHRDAWSFGKIRQPVLSLFPPVISSNISSNKGVELYHGAVSPQMLRSGDDPGLSNYSRQQKRQSPKSKTQQQQHVNGNASDANSIDSCLVCTRPKTLVEQEPPPRTVSSMGKIPPPSTPINGISTNDNNLSTSQTKQKLLSRPVPVIKREKPKVKPKLLLNVHLPRVPPSSMRAYDETEYEYPEDKIRKHVLYPRHHLETR